MNLSRCLLACDGNPDYLGFYPLVRRAWREVVGINTLLVLVAEEIPSSLHQFEPEIVLFRPLAGISTAFQAQCIRLLYPALLETEDGGAIIISDMDMAPLGERYFNAPLAHVGGDQFVSYRAGLLDEYEQLAICYNAATPQVWAEVFPGVNDEGDVEDRLREWWADIAEDYRLRDGAGWSTDQTQLYRYVRRWSDGVGAGRVTPVEDRSNGFLRLDRTELSQFRKRLHHRSHLLRAGRVSDFHMMQPSDEYTALNQQAIDEALKPASAVDRARGALRAAIRYRRPRG